MKQFFRQSVRLFPFWYILTLWLLEIAKKLFATDLHILGVHPRHWNEWYTMLSGALIHSNIEHLLNNTYPLAICGLFIYFLFERFSNMVFVFSYLLSGLLIFLFARSSTYHIGASGVAYSWAFLLAASGFFRKDRISLGLGLVVAFLYGSMIWGILPVQPGVSWDGHLYGAFGGVIVAYLFRNVNRKKTTPNHTENDDEYEFQHYQYGNFEYLHRRRAEEE